MRYPQGGGLTAERRQFREELRLKAAERFAQDEATSVIAKALRVNVRSVQRWRQKWEEGGPRALRSQGPASLPRLSQEQFARLEAELAKGPAAHGWEDQRWTLARIKTVIGRRFHMAYTIQGVRNLLARNGWSWQVPARRAMERDDEAVAGWVKEVWPCAEGWRRPVEPGSFMRVPAARPPTDECVMAR
ncbi:winged helix-turn-helix domain-containing protein [Streptomyces sp. SPB162]|uniref:helix-turn-helix domain-containing protein n=1 Tax=Streptomyces sp. SPB162 TaxID=2940560 RepID=UPI002404EE21|nr:winged helix-turn-helix domain-containing protein [Streptomyces sp. SPB162]MDF9816776.1 transposase [Streptomyces sp. SPB162]